VPGLLRWILALYQSVNAMIERLLYTVDEWLRFRAGDSQFALVYKPVLGLLWFVIAYVIRFVMNLVVEPQVNPIKHFPVVTVSHKFVFPFALLAHKAIEHRLTGGAPVPGQLPAGGGGRHIGGMFRRLSPRTIGGAVGLGIQFIVPGICGYLAWELRSNWRLYRANQAPTLDPVSIGHHGETMLRFIRPGLHSGTVPKLHARIRKAVRRGRWRSFNKRRADLHHVEESIRQFVERELIALLMSSRAWAGLQLKTGCIQLGSNNIQMEILAPGTGRPGLRIIFEQQAGWLIAAIDDPGWTSTLDAGRLLTLTNALAGFYKLCGVDLIREQVDACFRPSKVHWLVDAFGLTVWPETGAEGRAVYPLKTHGALRPKLEGAVSPPLPELQAETLIYSAVPISWDRWVETWTRDQKGEKAQPLVPVGLLG
jgi:hypothetical protein